ncbi:hypothetical protein [Alteromonas sp. OM2203]|uniref:hypothetical protein n=1 Tax=Alteromonas sp. OM2203 TaxID=3398817 RepID=UPI003AF38455
MKKNERLVGRKTRKLRRIKLLAPGMKMEFELVKLSNSRNESLFEEIEEFKFRALDLCSFARNTKWGMFEYSVCRSDPERPTISGTLPNESLLTTFYSKYRHVYLLKEKANFFKIAKSLSVSSNSDLFTLYHRYHLKRSFYKEFLLKFAFIKSRTSFSPEQVIDIWFNAYFFHGQVKEREKLRTLEYLVSEQGAKVALWQTIWQSHLVVGELMQNLDDTTKDYPYMKVPKFCRI